MVKQRNDIPAPTIPPCMLFCDNVIVEQGTGKTTLVGTFSGVAAPEFPSPPKDIHIYVQLTSLVADTEVKLTCLRLSERESHEVYSTEHVVQRHGKLTVKQIHIAWHQFQFPSAGEYLFQLWSEVDCIAERWINVRLKGGLS